VNKNILNGNILEDLNQANLLPATNGGVSVAVSVETIIRPFYKCKLALYELSVFFFMSLIGNHIFWLLFVWWDHPSSRSMLLMSGGPLL